jgi:hypothetical protein
MILSIDIGLRNLSMCCMSADKPGDLQSYKIHLWDVYNTLDSDDYRCQCIQKNGKICNKKCLYKYKEQNETIHCCKMHFPKDIKISKEHTFKKKMINDYLLQDIAIIFLSKVQEIYDTNRVIFDKISSVIIELQPRVNQKMKFVSHILYGKFVELYVGTKTTIRFVRASQKLKAYTGPMLECKLKGAYAKRKWLSIQYTKWFLENKFSDEQKHIWLNDFISCGKADDRSDTMLMAINAITGIPKRQKFQKNGQDIK